MTEMIRALIVDDHPMFREGLRVLLDAVDDVQVVGESATGEEAVIAAADLQPDVVLMDLNMPGLNGVEATRRIVGESPHIGVLALTMFDEDESVFQVMRAGARGYLLKGADQDEILRAVRAVAHGGAIFGPILARRLIGYFSAVRQQSGALPFANLTEREREVLEMVAAGKSNGEIARGLFVSPKTVRNHVSNIFSKLQVTDRAQAIVRAREAGLGQ
ncbi:MAG TPA: response regulator transcription factor [Mycobacteriales bacterium]|jgi:DNA-binding NarL/FixJ family response regulator|nr:response regulator transcription factor [Mycobacteriales bacterium]